MFDAPKSRIDRSGLDRNETAPASKRSIGVHPMTGRPGWRPDGEALRQRGPGHG